MDQSRKRPCPSPGGDECARCDGKLLTRMFIVCSGCNLNFCPICANVKESVVNLVADGEMPGFRWSCFACTNTLPTLNNISRTLSEVKDTNNRRLSNLENKTALLNTKVHTLKMEHDDKISQLSKDIEQVRLTAVNEISSDIEKVIDGRVRELDDRRRRNTNIIIFNIPEKTRGDGQQKKKEDEDDIRLLTSKIGIADLELITHFRLGKYDETKTRPLKVILGNKQQRKKILENVMNISKNCPSHLKKAAIKRDQTRQQREEFKEKKNKKTPLPNTSQTIPKVLHHTHLELDTESTTDLSSTRHSLPIFSPIGINHHLQDNNLYSESHYYNLDTCHDIDPDQTILGNAPNMQLFATSGQPSSAE